MRFLVFATGWRDSNGDRDLLATWKGTPRLYSLWVEPNKKQSLRLAVSV